MQNVFSWFQQATDLHFEEHFPKRTITMSYKNQPFVLTNREASSQLKDKSCMYTQVMLNPDDQQLNLKYKALRNEVTSTLRTSELTHYNDELKLKKSDLHITGVF